MIVVARDLAMRSGSRFQHGGVLGKGVLFDLRRRWKGKFFLLLRILFLRRRLR